jgi:signal peptidase I
MSELEPRNFNGGQSANLKGTWAQAIATFLLPLFLVFIVRWMIIEPFVIPSGSMIPNLLIHDHILVKKFSLGLKVPFTNYWLIRWRQPHRGEVLVFRFPENPDVFYIKRLVGLPGDTVSVSNGQVKVNGVSWPLQLVKSSELGNGLQSEDGFDYFKESSGDSSHIVRFYSTPLSLDEDRDFKVPEGHYFFMGDNRDQSSDGRVWGYVPDKYLVGPASLIWLSCENTLSSNSYLCDPREIRWKRLFSSVQ